MILNWKETLKNRLELYGHRNWLVIADSAYPAQSRRAIETIVVDEEQTIVLKQALSVIGGCKHIKPNIYTDKELTFINDHDAPGIISYRQELCTLLEGHEVRSLPHEEIIATLDRVGEKFRVMLIKTKMRIPYTSVFLELECGYWNDDAEERLRTAMRSNGGSRPTAWAPKRKLSASSSVAQK